MPATKNGPLFLAVVTKDVDAARIAIENGADVNGTGFMTDVQSDLTALFYAALSSLEMTKFLLSAGADPTIRSEGQTAFYAPLSGLPVRAPIAEAFIDAGVDLNLPPDLKNPISPLTYAVHAESYELADKMLSRGAKIDLCDDQGNTALLHFLSQTGLEGNLPKIAWLLEKGASVYKCNNHGRCAMDILPALPPPLRADIEAAGRLQGGGAVHTGTGSPITITRIKLKPPRGLR